MAQIAGEPDQLAFPGTTGVFGAIGTVGSLEGCVLASVPSRDELENLWIEVQRLVQT